MTVPLSDLDKRRAAKLSATAAVITATLERQGVESIAAAEFVEQHITLWVAPGLKILATADGGLRARGTSDEHLEHFARLLHLEHPELGGTPVPFGADPGPPDEGETEHQERLAADRAAASAAAQQADARHTANRQHATEAAQRIRGPDVSGQF